MKHLRAVTKDILKRVEEHTGKNIQFMRDEKLSVLATLHMARNGAEYHVLRYRPSDEPLDYLIAYQAGFLLRLFENEPNLRFDFAPTDQAAKSVELLLSAGQSLGIEDKAALPSFAGFVAQWALMNLRSLPIGMRIDQWIASEYPDLRDQQADSIALQQQQNSDLLAFKRGRLTIPVALMGSIAAYALFADRLLGNGMFTIPYEAAGLLQQGQELLGVWDSVPADAQHDRELVDRWAATAGQNGWYTWTPYLP